MEEYIKTPIFENGAKEIFNKIIYTEYDSIRELFGNMKKNVTFVNIIIINKKLYLYWNDNGFDDNDKLCISSLCKKSYNSSAGNNGLGIRNSLKTITLDPVLIISKNNKNIEYFKFLGIEKIFKTWKQCTIEYVNLFNKYSNEKSENGTLWVINLKDKIYKKFIENEFIILKSLIKYICCLKLKKNIKIYFNYEPLKLNNYLISKKNKNQIYLTLELGKIKLKNKNKKQYYAFRIVNFKELNPKYKDINEIIPIHCNDKKYETLSKNSNNIIPNSFELIQNSKCCIQLVNVFNNGILITPKQINEIKKDRKILNKKEDKKCNKLYNDICEEYNLTNGNGVHLCVNELFVLNKCFKHKISTGQSTGTSFSNNMGYPNKFLAIVYIELQKYKNLYYITPADKHTSRPTKHGLLLQLFLGLLYQYYLNPLKNNKTKKNMELELKKALKEKRKAEQEKQKAEQERLQAEEEKRKAEQEKLQAEQEKLQAEQEKLQAEQEKQKAEQEKQKAEQEKLQAEEKKRKAEQEKLQAEEERLQTEELALHLKNMNEKAKKKDKISGNMKARVWMREFGDKLIGECLFCEQLISPIINFKGQYSCAHIIPESSGGPVIEENLIYLCNICNSKCATKDFREYVKETKPKLYTKFITNRKEQLKKLNNIINQ